MKKPLSENYNISANDMLDMKPEQEVNGFKIENSEFYPNGGSKATTKNILVKENSEFVRFQIFSMKDGKFILEVDPDGENIGYFYSENLDDLTNSEEVTKA